MAGVLFSGFQSPSFAPCGSHPWFRPRLESQERAGHIRKLPPLRTRLAGRLRLEELDGFRRAAWHPGLFTIQILTIEPLL